VKTVLDIGVKKEEISGWFKELGLILPNDTLVMALSAMHHTKQSRAFIVTETGNSNPNLNRNPNPNLSPNLYQNLMSYPNPDI
jgi:hypothetical protein